MQQLRGSNDTIKGKQHGIVKEKSSLPSNMKLEVKFNIESVNSGPTPTHNKLWSKLSKVNY